MSYTPFARWRNFTLDNLKAILELYPDMVSEIKRDDAVNLVETKLKGYKKTAYQFACQLGLERRGQVFITNNYLYALDDEGLKKYMNFWFKMYVCPNPYVDADDSPINPFVEIGNMVINSPNRTVSFRDFCNKAFGEGKSIDIFKNALITWGSPLEVEDDTVFVRSEKETELKKIIEKVSRTLPMKNNKDENEFFSRFSCENYMSFYDVESFSGLNIKGDIQESIAYTQCEIGEDDFIAWMENTTLQKGMQKEYLYLLKSIPSALGFENVFTKKNVSSFDEYFERIKKNDFYNDSVNNIGAGALRSALKKYNQYLKERTMGVLSEDELVKELKSWYGQPKVENKTSSLTGFGFKYGALFEENKLKTKTIATKAGIPTTESPYIDKGVDLYKAIKKGTIGITFADNTCTQNSKIRLSYKTNVIVDKPWNRIIFGAPGTGKSHMLETEKDDFVATGGEFERVTFHPDYTYAQFVGTYKPRMKENGEIEYAYTPGPFLRCLVKALKSALTEEPHPVLLIIEEINRANMAAVFGDVFQLLDRIDGVSQYSVQTSEDMKQYLKLELGMEIESICLPDNLYIWATMNSADQGVFPMDTAFKRRWNFEYMDIDSGEEEIKKYSYNIAGKVINWNSLRKSINDWMADENINEDKQLGPFFISKQFLEEIENDQEKDEKFNNMFCSKVLMYLFDDACRSKRERLFASITEDKNYKKRYSSICKYFASKGTDIFNQDIKDRYNELTSEG